jgi:release factor glutamine methyltransferase
VAERNAAAANVAARVRVVVSDWTAALAPEERFDLVVSNPPYVASGDIASLAPEVRYDPHHALDGGADGLVCYRTIAGQASRLLKPAGDLVVELGIGLEAAVAALFRSAGLTPSPACADLAGIPRALHARVATMTP